MTKLSKQAKHYIVLYTGYLLALFIIFRNVILKNYANAFLQLFGFKSRWFVYDPNDVLPPIPGQPGTPGVPTYPDPDWNEIPIVTPNYWRFFFTNLFRSIVIFIIILVVYKVILWIIKRYDYTSKKQETIVYRFYMNTCKSFVDRIYKSVSNYLFELLKLFLNKVNIITMFLLLFVVSGWLPLIVSGLIQSTWDLFIHSPGVWSVLHGKAFLFAVFRILRSFNAINLMVAFIIIFVLVSFIYAYVQQKRNDIELEEAVNKMAYGQQTVGKSGIGKTRTLTALGSAAHRAMRKSVKEYLNDNESAYGRLVNFNDLRKFYSDHKHKLRNSIDCEDLAIKFVNHYKVPNIQMDRFRGRTPTLHEKIKWHFIGLWTIDKRVMLVSSVNMFIHDNELSDEVRNDIWDILTQRHEDVPALRFNFNAIKKTLKSLMGRVDEFGNLTITPKETSDFRRELQEANFSIEPCMTIILPELDKDFHNSDRSEIIKDGSDKILAILRHFVAFDERTFSHIFFDAQQPDGVANVVRGRFDSTLYLNESKQKRSLFFVPYILFLEKRIKMWEKTRDISLSYSPFKKSFFRVFVAWRAERLKRAYDYFTSFNYFDIKAKRIDALGQDNIRFKVNVSTSDYQYKSTQFQDIYQKAKRDYSTFRYENLEQWNGLTFSVNDAVNLHSGFVDQIFGIERPKPKEDEELEDDYLLNGSFEKDLQKILPGSKDITPKKKKGTKQHVS